MVGRVLRVIGTVVVMVVAFVTPVLATVAPAGADTVVDGCTIVSNPTPTNFTNCPGANLSLADLSGINLSYANLAGANLDGAILSSAVLVSANLSNASFPQANLTGADLSNANLSNAALITDNGLANLSNANLSSANLTSATLVLCLVPPFGGGVSCADPTLTGGILTDANLTNVALASCLNVGGGIPPGCGALDLSGVDLSGANFTGATFVACQPSGVSPPGCADANLTGATLTGATLTGTVLVPSDQTVAATSNAGAVVSWPTPPSLPGATPGTCTPPSGSTFPVGTTSVTCQVLDNQGNVATGTFTVSVVVPEVLIPSNGATLSGTTILDGAVTDPSAVTTFQYELTGGSYTNQVVATAKASFYGWLAQESNGTWGWDSTSVPSGTYTLSAVVTYNDGTVVTSPGITITVSNPAPTAQVLIPSSGATVSGTTFLDGTASYTPNITQFTYDLDGAGVGNAVATMWGWLLLNWNTTTVANGAHTLTAVATYADGATATSPGVTVTVSNP
jgi:uncharacterized protein YjbI with pentapeptide repeats